MRTILSILLCAAFLAAADLPRRAPGFALVDKNLQLHDLNDERGKLVVVEFMQTTCPHCAAFTSVLEKVQQKYGDKLAILAIANPPDTQTTVGQFIEGHKITYPVLFDCGQVAFSYLQTQQFNLPQVFLVDSKGMIRQHFEYGAMNRDIFEGNGLFKEIDRLVTAGAGSKK